MSTDTKFEVHEPMDTLVKRAMVEIRNWPEQKKLEILVELGQLTQTQADAALARLMSPPNPIAKNKKIPSWRLRAGRRKKGK